MKIAFLARHNFLDMEDCTVDFDISPFVLNPMGLGETKGISHEDIVANVMKETADRLKEKGLIDEEVEIYQLRLGLSGIMKAGELEIPVTNVSYSGIGISNQNIIDSYVDAGYYVVASAGNYYDNGETPFAQLNDTITVASSNDKGDHNSYSSWGEGKIDFTCIGNHTILGGYHRGTSFSSPVGSVYLMVFMYKFKDKFGRFPKPTEVDKWIIDKSIDVEEKGYDLKTGHGFMDDTCLENLNLDDYREVEMYTDVEQGDWFYHNVKLVQREGLMTGYPDGSFKPNEPITRAEVATIIANMVRTYNLNK